FVPSGPILLGSPNRRISPGCAGEHFSMPACPPGSTPVVGVGAIFLGRSPMLTLRLPDGSTKQVAEGTRPREIAESIGKRLAQAAVAAKFDDKVIDLDREFPSGNGEHAFAILTDKDKDALDVLRHSCAHIMARAVVRLFPGVQLAFGP